MPRTKRPVKKVDKVTDSDETLKKLNKLVADQKNKIDSHAYMEQRNVEVAFKILLGSIKASYLEKTVGQLKTELSLREVTNKRATRNSNRPDSHDDGYLTENSAHDSGERKNKKPLGPPSTIGRKTTRRSRSADASRMLTVSKTHNRSQSVYRTPMYNKNPMNYPAITPKVAPHTPLTVLRQPRQGEMVVSMSGSPVLVPSVYAMQQNEKASCNIMLNDGTMLSLQPRQLRQSQAFIPFSLMDSQVLSQLKTLKDNLVKMVELGEKTIEK
ncbi:PREDICTED: uncharacterized protein LOC106116438 isoform X1 [Papilio xuthus]|uniref:Uncharacterized protein LOC106116438 isoform X1 n=1 Tax=Papilio xuthus TaxID=66420 RepID=A0A194QHV9_PAPXU|nr:PREDICTED: uncharacterized protein LOC106116438 isoform X1 [Papilio xuthus]KPJ03041.1 hypothetical protein RR46_06199 [Papilio xuthus]